MKEAKYSFVMLIGGITGNLNPREFDVEGCSELIFFPELTPSKLEDPYALVFYDKRENKPNEIEWGFEEVEVIPFSVVPRRLKARGIIALYETVKDKALKQQLHDYIKVSELTRAVLDHLNITAVKLAKMLSSRPTDINMWLGMLAKPDSFKVDTLAYLSQVDDPHIHPYVRYLMSKDDKSHYIVEIINVVDEHHKRVIHPLKKRFTDLDEAKAYMDKVRNQFIGLAIEVRILDHGRQVIDRCHMQYPG